jgi:hypothetical protein
MGNDVWSFSNNRIDGDRLVCSKAEGSGKLCFLLVHQHFAEHQVHQVVLRPRGYFACST